jgi:hypothetical protein
MQLKLKYIQEEFEDAKGVSHEANMFTDRSDKGRYEYMPYMFTNRSDLFTDRYDYDM